MKDRITEANGRVLIYSKIVREERYGFTAETMRRWIKAGKLPTPIKFGRQYYFYEDELNVK